jgi:ATP-dependent DNA ligase
MEVTEIIREIRKARGSNDKVKVLREHQQNYQWLKFLKLCYDPLVSFYVSAPNLNNFHVAVLDDEFYETLDRLASRQITGHDAQKAANALSKKYGEPARLMLDHSIKAGIATKLINRVYGDDFVFTWPIMKAEKGPITRWPAWGSIKYDGFRLTIIKRGLDIYMHTSAGRLVYIKSIYQDIKKLPDGVYDGEGVRGDGRTKGRTGVNGALNSCLRGTKDDIEDFSFMCFDYLTLDEWDAFGSSASASFYDRYCHLFEFINAQQLSTIKLCEQVLLKDDEATQAWFIDLLERGFEGLIIRWPDDPYIFMRSFYMLKKKAEEECILDCIDVEYSKVNPNDIGSLTCTGEVEVAKVKYQVSVQVPHLSDWHKSQDPSYFIGKKIEVDFNTITSSGDRFSLFLPNFKRVVGEA